MADSGDETMPTASEETPGGTYIPPSIDRAQLLRGASYTYFSPVPFCLLHSSEAADPEPVYLGIDEAGRGPVLGPMVYGCFYLPARLSDSLLKQKHHFDDSKVLTASTRSSLMRSISTSTSPETQPQEGEEEGEEATLNTHTGHALSLLSAPSISSAMQPPPHQAPYNLNAQALDATLSLIRGVLDRGVRVTDIFVDTVGPPATHQARIARAFPGINVTVTKKADSLFPCVSAASVCAKVTRDAALDVLWEARRAEMVRAGLEEDAGWGSGYPSDARCAGWLRRNMHPVFGWGPECRFSWGTARDMLEGGKGVEVEWAKGGGEDGGRKVTEFYGAGGDARETVEVDELGAWFGTPAGLEAF